ncbi:hypothetical protein LguiB_036401 [Lonicera macranthoides]
MHKLRLLEVHNVRTPRVPEYLPSELRWLIWEEFPSESLPPRFEAENLVGLQLYQSSIERPWRGEKMMEKLKYIDLSYSQKLIRTPDFTWTPNLKRLILRGCKSLVELGPSPWAVCSHGGEKISLGLGVPGSAAATMEINNKMA